MVGLAKTSSLGFFEDCNHLLIEIQDLGIIIVNRRVIRSKVKILDDSIVVLGSEKHQVLIDLEGDGHSGCCLRPK
jgi:hypothetical protein